MREPTEQQQAIIEALADRHHVVIVEDYGGVKWSGKDSGPLLLTPADYCDRCGGDGFTIEEDLIEDCAACKGRGGLPILGLATVVFPSGFMPSVSVDS